MTSPLRVSLRKDQGSSKVPLILAQIPGVLKKIQAVRLWMESLLFYNHLALREGGPPEQPQKPARDSPGHGAVRPGRAFREVDPPFPFLDRPWPGRLRQPGPGGRPQGGRTEPAADLAPSCRPARRPGRRPGRALGRFFPIDPGFIGGGRPSVLLLLPRLHRRPGATRLQRKAGQKEPPSGRGLPCRRLPDRPEA